MTEETLGSATYCAKLGGRVTGLANFVSFTRLTQNGICRAVEQLQVRTYDICRRVQSCMIIQRSENARVMHASSLKCMGGKKSGRTDTVGSQINNSVVRPPSNGKRGKSGKEGKGGRASLHFPQFSRDISGQSCRGNGPFPFLDKSQHLKNILSLEISPACRLP